MYSVLSLSVVKIGRLNQDGVVITTPDDPELAFGLLSLFHMFGDHRNSPPEAYCLCIKAYITEVLRPRPPPAGLVYLQPKAFSQLIPCQKLPALVYPKVGSTTTG